MSQWKEREAQLMDQAKRRDDTLIAAFQRNEDREARLTQEMETFKVETARKGETLSTQINNSKISIPNSTNTPTDFNPT